MPEEHKYRNTDRDDFNDTSKPFNFIPEFKDLKKKKVLEGPD